MGGKYTVPELNSFLPLTAQPVSSAMAPSSIIGSFLNWRFLLLEDKRFLNDLETAMANQMKSSVYS